MPILHIALPITVNQTFDYISSNDLSPVIGGRVRVPFGNHHFIGIVTAISENSQCNETKLKNINEVLDTQSLFPKNLWRVLHWAINYYHSPPGEVLFHALPVFLRQGKPATFSSSLQWCITEKGRNILLSNKLKYAPKQEKILKQLLQSSTSIDYNIKNRTLSALQNKGFCQLSPQIIRLQYNWGPKVNKMLPLNKEQASAVNNIRRKEGQFIAWLLEGITGSGKTEVYLTVIEEIISKGKQALVLVPEIGLTVQTISRFRERFNAPVDVLHSGLNDKERLSVWLKSRNGDNAIVIGTRSALFTPFSRLGIIIIDEEHDSSYKQREGWRYHARDLAVYRAKEENITIILGTATPSMETLYNVHQQKYQKLTLSKRAGHAKNIHQSILNMKGLRLINGLSEPLIQKMKQHLQDNNQVMLFLNRRGFAPVILCHQCGWIAECSRCNHYYTLHYHQQQLRCHYCNNKRKFSNQCPICNNQKLRPIGIGTEKLEKTLSIQFPNIPVTRIDRDTTSRKGSLENYLTQVQQGGARILIGTQMLAKGHHFPDVTLVSLLDIDGALFSGDFRATERFAQLYTQVAGRAGRSEKQGEVLLQTYHPSHPILKTLLHNGYIYFAQKTLEERHQAGLPPFIHHILFRAEDYDNTQAELFLNQLRQLCDTKLEYQDNFCVLGPIPSLTPKRSGRFRWQLLLSHPSRLQLQQMVSYIFPFIRTLSQARKVKWYLDVDPIEN